MSHREKKTRTFETSSGEILNLVAVSQVDIMPVARQIETLRPRPPVEIIGGKPVENAAHPGYLKALEAFGMQYGVFMLAVFIEFGVDLELDGEQQAQVERRRKKRESVNPGAPENKFDTFIYVSMLCEGMDELTRLSSAIQTINNPTAEAVQNALDTFRPDVPRQALDANQNAIVRY